MSDYDRFGVVSRKRGGGFIKILATIVLALMVLQYAFHINVLSVFDNPKFDPFFNSIYSLAQKIWIQYLAAPYSVAEKYVLLGADVTWKYIEIVMAKLKLLLDKIYPDIFKPF
jgi:hypothetical protein